MKEASFFAEPAAVAEPATLADPAERLRAVAEENEALARDLLRCYEQLSLVFELTEHIANLKEPRGIQEALLRRYATMLGASAVYFECCGECVALEAEQAAGPRLRLDGGLVRRALAEEIRGVRQTRRARVPALTPAARQALRGAHVLLGALRQFDAETAVVIALRAGGEPDFDSGDMLASEAVLGYGGHILSNVLMVRQLQQTAVETVTALANAIDAKDNYTSGHSERVGWLAKLTGQALGYSNAQLQVLEWAGLLHDVGKIGVPESILNKPGKLTPEEFEEIKKHPRLGYEVLKPVASFGLVLDAVLYHHENHDGSGYPTGLRGEEIPPAARIIHVVDIFDALTSTRSYRPGFNVAQAFEILRKDAGRVTDPRITAAFLQAFERYMAEEPADFSRRFAHLAKSSPVPAGEPQERSHDDKPNSV